MHQRGSRHVRQNNAPPFDRLSNQSSLNICRNALTIVQWFTWGVSVGYEWLPTVVPLRNTVVPLKNIVDSTWVSQEL